MNSIKLILVSLCLLTPAAAFGREDSQLARVTVYWASGGSGSDHHTRNHRCATGTRLRAGHCAVDPRHIPYGSRVVLPTGETLAAVDTGSAVRNRRAARLAGRTISEKRALVIDRFFETKRQALTWANSHPAFMPIHVMPPNSRAIAFQTIRETPLPPRIQTTTTPRTQPKPARTDGPKSRVPLNRMGR